MAFEQGCGNKAGNMSLFAYINANIQRLILEHGDHLKVRRVFRWVRHRLGLLSQNFHANACITLSLVCREARGRGCGPPTDIREVGNELLTYACGVCPHPPMNDEGSDPTDREG